MNTPKVLNNLGTAIATTYQKHDTAILSGLIIGSFTLAAGFAARNVPKIKSNIIDAKEVYDMAKKYGNDEATKTILKEVTKDVTLEALPIIIFWGAGVYGVYALNKTYGKKLAISATALGLAQTALSEATDYAKKLETAVNSEDKEKIIKEIDEKKAKKSTEIFANANLRELKPGEDYFIDGTTGQAFISTKDKVEYAAEHVNHLLHSNGGAYDDYITFGDFADVLGLEESLANDILGWYPDSRVHVRYVPVEMPEKYGEHAGFRVEFIDSLKIVDSSLVNASAFYM